MKKMINNFILLAFVILYCFTLSLYGSSNNIPGTIIQNQTSEDNNSFSIAAANLLCHTIETKNAGNFINNLINPKHTDYRNNFTSHCKSAKKFYLNYVINSIFYSKNTVIAFDTYCISYPFHYFW